MKGGVYLEDKNSSSIDDLQQRFIDLREQLANVREALFELYSDGDRILSAKSYNTTHDFITVTAIMRDCIDLLKALHLNEYPPI